MECIQNRREEVSHVYHHRVNVTTATDSVIIHGIIVEIVLTDIELIQTGCDGQVVQRRETGHVGSPVHTILRPTDFMTDNARSIQVNLSHETQQISCIEILVTAKVSVLGHDVRINTGIELEGVNAFHNPMVANIITEEHIVESFGRVCRIEIIQGGIVRTPSQTTAIRECRIIFADGFFRSCCYKIMQGVLIQDISAAALVTTNVLARILRTIHGEIIVSTAKTLANADNQRVVTNLLPLNNNISSGVVACEEGQIEVVEVVGVHHMLITGSMMSLIKVSRCKRVSFTCTRKVVVVNMPC